MVYSCEEKGTGTPYAAKILKKTVSVGGGVVWGVFLLRYQSTLAPGRAEGCQPGIAPTGPGVLDAQKHWGLGWGFSRLGGYWVHFAAAEEMGPGTDVGNGREQWGGVSAGGQTQTWQHT